jgi:hypothetical protein
MSNAIGVVSLLSAMPKRRRRKMLDLAGGLFVVLLLALLSIIITVGAWVVVNILIKIGLRIYKDCLDLRAEVREHEGRKKKS